MSSQNESWVFVTSQSVEGNKVYAHCTHKKMPVLLLHCFPSLSLLHTCIFFFKRRKKYDLLLYQSLSRICKKISLEKYFDDSLRKHRKQLLSCTFLCKTSKSLFLLFTLKKGRKWDIFTAHLKHWKLHKFPTTLHTVWGDYEIFFELHSVFLQEPTL